MPVSVDAAVRQNVVTELSSPSELGKVLCSLTPVSPVTPLNVSATTLAAGGMMVTQVGTVAPPVGTVMVLAPEARF